MSEESRREPPIKISDDPEFRSYVNLTFVGFVVFFQADMQSWREPETPWIVWAALYLALTMFLLAVRRYVRLGGTALPRWGLPLLHLAIVALIAGILYETASALFRYR